MSYAVANAFTAISYFVLLLNLSMRYDVWWFTYAAFWCVFKNPAASSVCGGDAGVMPRYLPYMAASGVVFFASASAENSLKAIALPSDVHYIRWALNMLDDKSRWCILVSHLFVYVQLWRKKQALLISCRL